MGPRRTGAALALLRAACVRERAAELGAGIRQRALRAAKTAPEHAGCHPLELIDRLVLPIPPPRIHRHRYHGVLAPNARLRAAVTARANQAVEGVVAIPPPPGNREEESAAARTRSAAVRLWAALLARIYEVFPLLCPSCKGEMRLIAFLTERSSIEKILTHLGEPIVPPPIVPARAPPGSATDLEQRSTWDIGAEPVPEIDFDQRQSW